MTINTKAISTLTVAAQVIISSLLGTLLTRQ